jgi:hypothetical protein
MSVGSNDIFTPPAVEAQVDRTMQHRRRRADRLLVNVQAAVPRTAGREGRRPAQQRLDQPAARRRAAALRQPAIVHWAEHLASSPNRLARLLRDGLHPSVPLGQNARNGLIVDAIKAG